MEQHQPNLIPLDYLQSATAQSSPRNVPGATSVPPLRPSDAGTAPPLSNTDKQLKGATPSYPSNMLNQTITMPQKPGDFVIEPLSRLVEEDAPEGWSKFAHPNGAKYYATAAQNTEGIVIFTYANLQDQATRKRITSQIGVIRPLLPTRPSSFSEDVELVLWELYQDSWCYYLADTTRHIIFWLDRMPAKNLGDWLEIRNVPEGKDFIA